MSRTVADCKECGKNREIVAYGLCARCNQRIRNAAERLLAGAAEKKKLQAYFGILGSMISLNLASEDREKVKAILAPHLGEVPKIVNIDTPEEE
jgi:hypothetical protein